MDDDRKTGRTDFARVGDLLGGACALPAKETAGVGVGNGGPGVVTPGGKTNRPVSGSAPGAIESAPKRIAEVWAGLVGEEVAANAQPVHLRRGRLVVSTSSTVWAHSLQFMGEMLVRRLNEYLGEGTVNDVVFRHAGWEERSPRSAGANAVAPEGHSLSAEEQTAVDAVARMTLPPHIRDQILRAMTAAFARGKHGLVR